MKLGGWQYIVCLHYQHWSLNKNNFFLKKGHRIIVVQTQMP